MNTNPPNDHYSERKAVAPDDTQRQLLDARAHCGDGDSAMREAVAPDDTPTRLADCHAINVALSAHMEVLKGERLQAELERDAAISVRATLAFQVKRLEADVSRLQQEHARLQAENGLLKRSLGILERTISEAEGR